MGSPAASEVYLIDASDRQNAIDTLWHEIGLPPPEGKSVAFKANFNSDDPFPASTHPETLEAIVERLRDEGAREIRLGERSGMGDTRMVLKNRGVVDIADRKGVDLVILDELPVEGWQKIPPEGLHWERGFLIAKMFLEADMVVQTCCCKTHRFGGHFTMSLKNSVGLVAGNDSDGRYNYMAELHSSPHQRLMIAEINKFYTPDVVFMDATECFTTGGPEKGSIIKPNIILASSDRIALDAAGIALLRSYGSTPAVMRGRIFELEQIARAGELGVGVRSAEDLRLVALDSECKDLGTEMRRILDETG
jgi:uncharacterized protein (DUF362 family)